MNSLNKKTIPLMKAVGGASFVLNTYLLKGEKTGPRVYIQAGLHGAEIQGNAVIFQLIQELKDKDFSGEILFAPVVNPYGTNQKIGTNTLGRYNPITGNNWNRNFLDILKDNDLTEFCKKHLKDSEDLISKNFKTFLKTAIDEHERKLISHHQINMNNNLNLQLQKLAAISDIVLDLHTGPTSTEYLYTPKRSFDDSRFLQFENILVIKNEFSGAMDEASFMPWVYLENKFKELGREVKLDFHAYTLELKSEEVFDMTLAKSQCQKILNYLSFKGILNDSFSKQSAHYSDLENFKTLYAPVSGFVDYVLPVGSHYKKGDLLCSLYQMEDLELENLESSITEVRAKEDGVLINRCPTSNLLKGMELFQVLTKIQTIN